MHNAASSDNRIYIDRGGPDQERCGGVSAPRLRPAWHRLRGSRVRPRLRPPRCGPVGQPARERGDLARRSTALRRRRRKQQLRWSARSRPRTGAPSLSPCAAAVTSRRRLAEDLGILGFQLRGRHALQSRRFSADVHRHRSLLSRGSRGLRVSQPVWTVTLGSPETSRQFGADSCSFCGAEGGKESLPFARRSRPGGENAGQFAEALLGGQRRGVVEWTHAGLQLGVARSGLRLATGTLPGGIRLSARSL